MGPKKFIGQYIPRPMKRWLELDVLPHIWQRLPAGKPPHGTKLNRLRKAAAETATEIFIETGTYRGETLKELHGEFRELHSIELDKRLAKDAQSLFASNPEVHVYQGNSAQVLPTILNTLSEPCLFWLDAHYSGGVTARGDALTPILDELDCIADWGEGDSAILVDDVDDFRTLEKYPEITDLKASLRAINPEYRIFIKDNILHALP